MKDVDVLEEMTKTACEEKEPQNDYIDSISGKPENAEEESYNTLPRINEINAAIEQLAEALNNKEAEIAEELKKREAEIAEELRKKEEEIAKTILESFSTIEELNLQVFEAEINEDNDVLENNTGDIDDPERKVEKHRFLAKSDKMRFSRMHDVFISYSAKNQQQADDIFRTLESRGMKCWIASRDITPGDNFHDKIVQAIKDCKVLLLVFSKHANESKDVTQEVRLAYENDKRIIPYLLDDTKFNNNLAYTIGDTHWMNSPGGPHNYHELADEICGSLKLASPDNITETTLPSGKTDMPSSVRVPGLFRRPAARRALLICALAAAIIVIAIFLR